MTALIWVISIVLATLPAQAIAAGVDAAPQGLRWGLPFAGLLVSIAVCPLVAPRFWHHRMGLVAAGWSLALIVPLTIVQGAGPAAQTVWHAVLIEYLPFVMLLLALFTAGGGILMQGGPWGTPAGNTLLLAIGTALAGVMGTTGVSMVLIHPLLRANAHRRSRVHLVVFFILLCANAGGATTPLGDPPLYIGFLRGVPFFWPMQALLLPLLLLASILLGVFYLYDRHLAGKEAPAPAATRLRITGTANIGLIAIVVACVLMQGVWHPGLMNVFGQPIEIERVVGMIVFGLITALSLTLTPKPVRQGNLFSWEPMAEVGKLFAAIFITIGPVLTMLAAGREGPLAAVLALTTDAKGAPSPLAYFWIAGLLSAFLDNAPTYLVFFQMAGDDAARLTGELSPVLTALSAGAVFFGAVTYIGNAPNMMLRAIAGHRGIRMPGFFAYIGWSALLLGPIFVLLTLVFFH